MSDENHTPNPDVDPLEASSEADVSDGSEQKQKPVDLPTIDEVH
jgi:hypothetical protein